MPKIFKVLEGPKAVPASQSEAGCGSVPAPCSDSQWRDVAIQLGGLVDADHTDDCSWHHGFFYCGCGYKADRDKALGLLNRMLEAEDSQNSQLSGE